MKTVSDSNTRKVILCILCMLALPTGAQAQVIVSRPVFDRTPVQPIPAPQPEEVRILPEPVEPYNPLAPKVIGVIPLPADMQPSEVVPPTPAAPEPVSQPAAPAPAPAAPEPVSQPVAPAPAPSAEAMPVETQFAGEKPIDTAALSAIAPSAGPVVTKAAAPQSDSMFIAAGQVGGHHSHYATTGVMTALPGSKLGDGWVARVFAEEIGYRYKAGAREIDGTAVGGSVSFGYQHSYSEGWLGAYTGVAYHHTHLSPDDRSSEARGGKTAAHLQVEGEHRLTKDFKLNANAVADVSDNTAYWTRLRALYRVTDDIFAGPEGVYQGDKDYKSWATGLAVVGVPVTDKSSVGMDAGVRKSERVPASGYAGIEFGMDF